MKTHKWKKTQNQAVPCFLTWGVCVSNPFLSFVELFFFALIGQQPHEAFLENDWFGVVFLLIMIWSRWFGLTKKWMLSYKKERIPTVCCNTPFPSLAPLSRRNFFTPVLPPQIYLSTGGVLDPICFEHPKHFFSLYCSRVFQLFWISFGGESCIFQVFPHWGEKDIIDEYCRRYSLLLFDVSNHSKVPPLDFITLFTQSFSDLWGR